MIEVLRKGGLRRRIWILMLVVGVFPGIVGVFFVYFVGKKLTLQSAVLGLIGTAEKAASEVRDILNNEVRHATLFADLERLREFTWKANERYLLRDKEKSFKEAEGLWSAGDPRARRSVLENEVAILLKGLRDAHDYCHIMVTDNHGALIASTDLVPKFFYAGEIWWHEAMSGKPYIGGPYPCDRQAEKGRDSFYFAIPVPDPEGKSPIGVVYIDRSTDSILKSLEEFRYGETGHLEIIDTKGSFVMEALGAKETPVPKWLIKEVQEKKRGWAIGVDEHGVKSVKGFVPVEFGGWYVILSQQANEIYAPMKFLMSGAAIPGFLTVIILAFVWFNISKRMVLEPISKLSKGAYQVGQGDLDYRLDIKTGDELEELAHEFNTMAENLNTSHEKLSRWNDDLRREVAKRTAELEETNEELKESKEELEDTLHEVMSLNDQLQAHREELSRKNDDLANANVKLREMDRLKSEFLANMSHELRTPLTAVIGFSELLIDRVMGELNEEQTGCVDNILTSGQHLLRLINDILDLSKIEAGKMELHLETFQLATIVNFVTKTVAPLTDKKEQALIIEIAENIPDIYADPGKIKQLLLNLVGNAIKFTPNGGKVTIGSEFKDNHFILSVADTGIGIKHEDREMIFQEFQQAEGSTSREYGGTGLGLTLTKKLTEMHGGRIEVESEIGKGSRFIAYLPYKIEKRLAIKEEAGVGKTPLEILPELPRGVETQPLILVVEDDPKLSRLISVYLSQAGYRVETAMDGDEGIRKARELQPFAITLDIMLPKKDGWEVLQELKGVPETRDIPVTIVSMVENQELGFSLGAADYLVKPVGREDLLDSIGKYSFTTKVSKERIRVVVIDDDPKIVEFLTAILRKEGFQVTSATGGEEGLRVTLEEFPDFIVLDLMMPRVSGFDVIRELKKHPISRDIPIFVLTAKDLSREEKERLLSDVSRVFQKGGFTKEELLEEIKRMEIHYPGRAGLIDNVTGLFNYRYFVNRLSHEISRSRRYARGLSASIVDIDSFRHYNEINGRIQGDIILREIARLLNKNLRKSDIAMRYSGGKFAVMFPETTKDAALSVAEKLRILIEGYPFPKRENQPSGRLTVSASVVTYPADGETALELIERMERGVLEAEKAGGNRVVEV